MRKIIAFLTILSGSLFVALLIFYISLISKPNVIQISKNSDVNILSDYQTPQPDSFEKDTFLEIPNNNISSEKISYNAFYCKEITFPFSEFDSKFIFQNRAVEFYKLSDVIIESRINSYNIYYKNNNIPIINNNYSSPAQYRIEGVPLILQNPELPRGCEVTSLAMLMKFYGIETDKLILAEKIKRDTTPRKIIDKKIYWGNPDNGFIGDIYDMKKPGLGVYHTPIFELLSEYTERAVDITGCNFDDLKWILNNDMPVWVIINTTYALLPESSFQTWHTDDGEIKVTYREHSALITGYDEHFVYLNDPLSSYVKVKISPFIECWEQMGSQAVTLNP